MNDKQKEAERLRTVLRTVYEQRALLAETALIASARILEAKANVIREEVEHGRALRKHEEKDREYSALAKKIHDLECPFCSAAIAANQPTPHPSIN